MLKECNRIHRISQEMQRKIAIILQRKIKDPRVGMATVSGVEVSRDLTYAKVFVTFLNNNTSEQVKTGVRVLQEAAGFIRSLLVRDMRLRLVPDLKFAYDNSLVEGRRMANLVSIVMENDRHRREVNLLDNKGIDYIEYKED